VGSGSQVFAELISGSEEWRKKEIQYDLAGEDPTISFVEDQENYLIKFNIDGEEYETSTYHALRLTASRDTVFIDADVRTSSSSSSSSSSSVTSNGRSYASKSSSSYTSTDEHKKSFGFIEWNDKKIVVQLQGGNTITRNIEVGPAQCLIEFDIDRGKHKRTILLEKDSIEVDGQQKGVGAYSILSILADKKPHSLKIEADEEKVWVEAK
jgi:hypothetical protein